MDFYRAFDRELLRDAANPDRKTDYRSIFHQDRDRIMFSPAFRRLQAKTQVFQAGEYDFYRTRLTHSLEVSRIAESITIWLRTQQPDVQIDPHLLEAISLAHDLGHPPFGHAGERALNVLMREHGGFEGNAQTLRLLTRTIYSRERGRRGMSPSRALLDGVLKYKRLYTDRGGDTHHFIYDDQAEVLEFCFGTRDLAPRLDGAPVNKFKSLECQIMDLADDIAYSCFDIVDGWKARFLAPDKLDAWVSDRNAAPTAKLDQSQRAHALVLRDLMARGKLQASMNGLVGEFIQSASLQPWENFMSPQTSRYAYQVVVDLAARTRIELQKALSRDLVYGSSALRQIEFKGERLLGLLARTLFENYLSTTQKPTALVPGDTHRQVLDAPDATAKARLLCDYISGMTDAYALRSYKRLLDPDYGSISELI
jgi:dGTPase